MSRHQSGYIYEASDTFFVRYYVAYNDLPADKREDIAATRQRKGKPPLSPNDRVLYSHRLCTQDEKHHSRACKPVKQLAADHMKKVNAKTATVNDETVASFWEKTYLPFAEENLRASTVHGYKQIWGQHLEPHFGTTALRDYQTHIGSLFLTSLSKKLGRHTIQHIRSLASGIFAHAVNVGVIESNPWHDVKVLGKTKEPGETEHYTLEEAEDIISALVEHVDCQLIVALAFFLGLRPGEIQGLCWEDIDSMPGEQGLQWIHIRRAVARNIVGETKTTSSVASLPLISPVKIPLELWRKKSGNKTEGWVFPNKRGKPVDLRSVIGRTIVPTLTEKKIEWKTLYAGRRGAATILTQLTGDALAAKELLRHKNIAVTTDKYVKAIPEALMKGIKLLEAAATNGK
ncbi:MAG: tyrosine-type recombinase/integrase [Candidatus Sulfotelmatobacter sp.]